MIIMKAIADGMAGTAEDCENMIDVLSDQVWNDMIPLYLSDEVRVAHKTGSITGVHHDMAIVYLPDGRSYVLVLLSKTYINVRYIQHECNLRNINFRNPVPWKHFSSICEFSKTTPNNK